MPSRGGPRAQGDHRRRRAAPRTCPACRRQDAAAGDRRAGQESRALNGLDSLLSIAQMPAGVPVATMAIGNAANAALFAARILALDRPALRARLEARTAAYRARGRSDDSVIRTIGILGGGQLGRMLTLEAKRMGYRVVTLEPFPNSPTGQSPTSSSWPPTTICARSANSARAAT
jgi:hypothetical protein